MSSHSLMAPTAGESGGSRCGARTWDALLIFAAGTLAFTVGLPQEFLGLDARSRVAILSDDLLAGTHCVVFTTREDDRATSISSMRNHDIWRDDP